MKKKPPQEAKQQRAKIIAAAVALGVMALAGLLIWFLMRDRGPAFARVQGTVTLDGKPLAQVYVGFFAEGGQRRALTPKPTDENGHYQIPSDEDLSGVVVGPNHVVVVPTPDAISKSAPATMVPNKYRELLSTPLQFNVSKGEQNIEIPLSSAP